jgi:hypothetical protein
VFQQSMLLPHGEPVGPMVEPAVFPITRTDNAQRIEQHTTLFPLSSRPLHLICS